MDMKMKDFRDLGIDEDKVFGLMERRMDEKDRTLREMDERLARLEKRMEAPAAPPQPSKKEEPRKELPKEEPPPQKGLPKKHVPNKHREEMRRARAAMQAKALGVEVYSRVLALLMENEDVPMLSREVVSAIFPQYAGTKHVTSGGFAYTACNAALTAMTRDPMVPITRKGVICEPATHTKGAKVRRRRVRCYQYLYHIDTPEEEPIPPPGFEDESQEAEIVEPTRPAVLKAKSLPPLYHGYAHQYFMGEGKRLLDKITRCVLNGAKGRVKHVKFTARELRELGIYDSFHLVHSKPVLTDLIGWVCTDAIHNPKYGNVHLTFRK